MVSQLHSFPFYQRQLSCATYYVEIRSPVASSSLEYITLLLLVCRKQQYRRKSWMHIRSIWLEELFPECFPQELQQLSNRTCWANAFPCITMSKGQKRDLESRFRVRSEGAYRWSIEKLQRYRTKNTSGLWGHSVGSNFFVTVRNGEYLYKMENEIRPLPSADDDSEPTLISESAAHYSEQAVLWASHPLSRSLLSKSHLRKDFDASSFDIDSPSCKNSPSKDISEYSFKSPT